MRVKAERISKEAEMGIYFLEGKRPYKKPKIVRPSIKTLIRRALKA